MLETSHVYAHHPRHDDGWIDCVSAPNVILQIEFLFHPMPLPGPPPQADVPTPEKEKQVKGWV